VAHEPHQRANQANASSEKEVQEDANSKDLSLHRTDGERHRYERIWLSKRILVEREWRYNEDFKFSWSEVVFGLCPERRIEEFESMEEEIESADEEGHKIKFVDPKWSLERIIAHLAGCKSILTPFD
jgi:hypothetical protein